MKVCTHWAAPNQGCSFLLIVCANVLPRNRVRAQLQGLFITSKTQPRADKHRKTRTKRLLNRPGLCSAYIGLINSNNHGNDVCSRAPWRRRRRIGGVMVTGRRRLLLSREACAEFLWTGRGDSHGCSRWDKAASPPPVTTDSAPFPTRLAYSLPSWARDFACMR